MNHIPEVMEYLEDEAFKKYRYGRSGPVKSYQNLLIAHECVEKQKREE